MAEQLVSVGDGAELCVETFGRATDPTIVLIAGGAQSMVWWDAEFCRRLAGGGRHVVRYDHRDTGRSSASPAGHPNYTAKQFGDDPRQILPALGVDAAHLVGLSMGGGIAQVLAVQHPDLVQTVTLMSTTPAGPYEGPPLPGPAPQVAATFNAPGPEPDWTNRDAVLAYRIAIERPYAGSLGFDEARTRRLATLEVDRTTDMAASSANHSLLGDGWPAGAALADITVPALVLHGTTDPMFPLEHGRTLARLLPQATLVELPGVGHEQPPPQFWDLVVSAIIDHSAGRSERTR